MTQLLSDIAFPLGPSLVAAGLLLLQVGLARAAGHSPGRFRIARSIQVAAPSAGRPRCVHQRMRMLAAAALGFLLLAAGAEEARAHKAHQADDSITREAIGDGGAADLLETTASVPTGPAGAEAAGHEPSVTRDPASSRQAHPPVEAPPEPVSILEWLGRLHPMVIHFPIALFLAAFVAELLYAATRGELFRHALRFTLWGAAMSAFVAAPLGWLFAATGATEEGWLLEAHRWAGTASLGLGVAVLWVAERTERANGTRLLLRVSLLLQALLIGSTGFLGGSLLYGFDHLWRGIGCCSP